MSKIKISKYGKVLLYSSFLLIVLGLVTLFSTKAFKVEAQDTDTVTTSVTVGNTAPSFTAGPAEATASTSTAPTAIGSSVTFNATAADANGENYYLIVCSTNSVTAGTSGNAPTCAAGATTYCTSSSTASASAASCSTQQRVQILGLMHGMHLYVMPMQQRQHVLLEVKVQEVMVPNLHFL